MPRHHRGAKNMQIPDNLPVYRKTYALTLEVHRSIRNMPRDYRYTLGAEIAELSLDCLDLAVSAAYAPKNSKHGRVLELSRLFDKLSLRIRIMQELDILSPGQFAHWQENYLTAIGSQIGGWLNNANDSDGPME